MQKPPPIQWLPVFEAAARLLNFKEASEELCVSPSAVSQQMKILEEYLGVSLFDRSTRKLRLTDAGQFYYQYVEKIIKTHVNGYRHFERKYRHPTLQLNAPIFAAQELLIPNYPYFSQYSPGVDLRITTGNKIIDFESEPIDAALRFGTGNWPGLDCRFIIDVEPRLICSPQYLQQHALNPDCLLTQEDLEQHTLLSVFEDLSDWQDLLTHVEPSKKIVCDSYLSVIRATEEGLGIGIGLKPVVNHLVDNQRLVFLNTNPMSTDYSYWLVAPHNRANPDQINALYQWLKSLFDTL